MATHPAAKNPGPVPVRTTGNPANWRQPNHEPTDQEVAAVQAAFVSTSGTYPSDKAARQVLSTNNGNVTGAIKVFQDFVDHFQGTLAEKVHAAATKEHDRGDEPAAAWVQKRAVQFEEDIPSGPVRPADPLGPVAPSAAAKDALKLARKLFGNDGVVMLVDAEIQALNDAAKRASPSDLAAVLNSLVYGEDFGPGARGKALTKIQALLDKLVAEGATIQSAVRADDKATYLWPEWAERAKSGVSYVGHQGTEGIELQRRKDLVAAQGIPAEWKPFEEGVPETLFYSNHIGSLNGTAERFIRDGKPMTGQQILDEQKAVRGGGRGPSG